MRQRLPSHRSEQLCIEIINGIVRELHVPLNVDRMAKVHLVEQVLDKLRWLTIEMCCQE